MEVSRSNSVEKIEKLKTWNLLIPSIHLQRIQFTGLSRKTASQHSTASRDNSKIERKEQFLTEFKSGHLEKLSLLVNYG